MESFLQQLSAAAMLEKRVDMLMSQPNAWKWVHQSVQFLLFMLRLVRAVLFS